MKFHSSALIQSTLSGLGIGFPVTLICMSAIGGFNSIIFEFLVWMVASALFGILSGVLFYSHNELSLPAAMALHCLGCFAVAVCAAAVIGYAESLSALILAILPVFVVVYVIIYAVCILIMKHEEKQINQSLSKD